MSIVLSLLIAILTTFPLNPATLSVPTAYAAAPTTLDLQAYASSTAQEYGLNAQHLANTINCESQWKPDATSTTGDFGIVQINAKAHPEITPEERLDPFWSIDWMAEQWSTGHERAWTCWRRLYGN